MNLIIFPSVLMINFSVSFDFKLKPILQQNFLLLWECVSVLIVDEEIFFLLYFNFQKNTYKFFFIFILVRWRSKQKCIVFVLRCALESWLRSILFFVILKNFIKCNITRAYCLVYLIFFNLIKLFKELFFCYPHTSINIFFFF